jgi:Mrp family chromosome partitioning ATPase
LQAVRLPALAVAALLAFSWIAWSAVRARSRDPLAASGGTEEPLLRPPHVIACRSGSPVVVIVGMAPGSGVSTLAFNLAVSLAVEGEVSREEGVRSPRPICLLAEGPLTEALGLSPAPLEDHLGQHLQRIDADLVDLPVRHVSGCELLCMGREGRAVEHLKLLVEELRRLYDSVLVDGACGKGQVEDVAVDVGDAMLLVGRHSESLLEAAGPWVERVFALEIEHKTMLILNRVTAWPQPPREPGVAFLYQAQLPDEPAVAANDAQGLPWCIDGRLSAARRLADIVRCLFPTLMRGAASNAA